MNILIAEDSPVLQMLHGKLMEKWGYDYDMASNGLEVVEYAKNNNGKYDLCIMDIEMPVMNGIKAAKIIRKTVDYFPIMALTTNDEYKEECLKIGMDDFVVKPCLSDKLFAKISGLTVKFTKVHISENNLFITKETPMNSQQTSVLKQLKEQKLSVISIFGTSTEATFVVNDDVPQYIEKEFAENQKQSVRFLDHSPEGKGLCHLFSKTSMVVKKFMLDEDFESENQREIKKLKGIFVSSE